MTASRLSIARFLVASVARGRSELTALAQFVFGLVVIGILLAVLTCAIYLVMWVVLFLTRYAPIVGRRHQRGPRVARQPIAKGEVDYSR